LQLESRKVRDFSDLITRRFPEKNALTRGHFHSFWISMAGQGVGVQVGWQGQLGSSKGQAGVQVGTGVKVLV
jgi:hypothetical protein